MEDPIVKDPHAKDSLRIESVTLKSGNWVGSGMRSLYFQVIDQKTYTITPNPIDPFTSYTEVEYNLGDSASSRTITLNFSTYCVPADSCALEYSLLDTTFVTWVRNDDWQYYDSTDFFIDNWFYRGSLDTISLVATPIFRGDRGPAYLFHFHP